MRVLILILINCYNFSFAQGHKNSDETCRKHNSYLDSKVSKNLDYGSFVSKLLQNKPEIVFIGEFHSNPNNKIVQESIINLIHKFDINFNCVFKEERNPNSDASVELHKKIQLFQDFTLGKNKELALKIFGEQLLNNEDIFVLHSYAIENGTQVYFASKSFLKSLALNGMHLFYHDTSKTDENRDSAMFENIYEKFSDGTCKKAIVLNGAAHISRQYKAEINQPQLFRNVGYSSMTTIILDSVDLEEGQTVENNWAHVCGKPRKLKKWRHSALFTGTEDNGEIIPGPNQYWKFRWNDFDSIIIP